MKLLVVILYFFSLVTFAKTAYEIPRSIVIDLKQPSTQRIYPITIKLPLSYQREPDKQYPVIYLTDAPYAFQLVSGATRPPMNSGTMDEAIIVAVGYSSGSKGASSRVRDYTPSKAKSWKMETGKASSHLNFFKKVLFPHIESNYRVQPDQRTYMGHSLGGLFGAYILLTKPETFSAYVLGSPSIWFNDNYILSLDKQLCAAKTKVYLSVGGLEKPEFGERENMVNGSQLLVEKLKQQKNENLLIRFVIVDNAKHSTVFPTIAIQGLDWIYGKK